MYSNLKSVQYVVAMLKARGINKCVVSPGNSHNAIVRSIEEDGFFTTYNIVDERSAAFFAVGLIQELKEPVVILCTAGTALSNYLSGMTEAFYRQLPLVAITADKNPYYVDQYEDQTIIQNEYFKNVVKYQVTLPIVKDEKDEWYVNRVLNEAFLEMSHHGSGPIHINVPIDEGRLAIGPSFTALKLPQVNLIERLDCRTSPAVWQSKIKSLAGKKILFLYGQDSHISVETQEAIARISSKLNCIFATDHLSNLHGPGVERIARAALCLGKAQNQNLAPDVVVSLAGNTVLEYKFELKSSKYSFEHWIVNEKGKVADPYRKLTTVFEMSANEFIELLDGHLPDRNLPVGCPQDAICANPYLKAWQAEQHKFRLPEFDFSNIYAVKNLIDQVPGNSVLNLGNSSTVRLAQYFDIDPSVQVYCNRGVNGIDGCVSTFIGQCMATDQLSFLIVGDLAFFYDMNALWNRYIKKNMRIMLNNNSGAALFHFKQGLKNYPTLNENVAADHSTTVRGWALDQGFRYLSAHNKKEFDAHLPEFTAGNSDKPIIFEVFTEKEKDAELLHQFFDLNMG